MEYPNFTLVDLAQIFASLLLYPPFLLIPGYLTGWYTKVLSFRARTLPVQVLLGVALSMAVCPIATYLAARFGGFGAVWVLYGGIWIGFLVHIVARWRRASWEAARNQWDKNFTYGFLFVLGWIVVGIGSLIDIQYAGNLFHPHISDYIFRIPVADALFRTGVPPATPFFFPGHPVPLFYYYLWLQECALVKMIAAPVLDVRSAVLAGTIWAGIALVAITALYPRLLDGNANRLRRRSLIAVLLLLVTGLDLVPIFGEFVAFLLTGEGRFYQGEIWNWDQVSSWINSLLWVPHHVAALVACLSGFMVLRSAGRSARRTEKIWSVVLAACAFASACGMSVWVTLVAAASLAVYAAIVLARRSFAEFRTLLAVGLLSMALAAPFLVDLQRANLFPEVTPIAFSIRTFRPATLLLNLLDIRAPWVYSLVYLLVLPLNYFLELGFFFFVGVVHLRRLAKPGFPLSQDERFHLVLLLTSLLICTFFRSAIINNDLGWRGFMLAQFVLLLWSVDEIDGFCEKAAATKEPFISWLREERYLYPTLMIILGVLATAHNVVGLRMVPIIARHDPYDHGGSKRSLVSRQVYGWLDRNTPLSAVFQFNPDQMYRTDRYTLYPDNTTTAHSFAIYGHRQVVASEQATYFGVSKTTYFSTLSQLEPIFMQPSSVDTVDAICKRFAIDYLIITHRDPVWHQPNSWVYRREPLIANEFLRVYRMR